MRGYLLALVLSFTVLFSAIWLFLLFNFSNIIPTPEQITIAHNALIAKCDVGDLDVLGNSEANADVIPSRIGAGVREFALTGGTPMETYYIARDILKCPRLPNSVMIIFNTAALGDDPLFLIPQKTDFWEQAAMIRNVNFWDILKYSNQFNTDLITGPKSLFDLDYRIKAMLYSAKFPPYFELELRRYFLQNLQARPRHEFQYDRKTFYAQTVADEGHHFYGMMADATGVLPDTIGELALDHDAYRVDDKISPFEDFFMRRTIEELTAKGVKVYYVLPPMNRSSAEHYPPDLVSIYENYLAKLQASEPGFQLIGDGFPVWAPTLFGDQFHLNLRGGLAFSEDVRKTLISIGRSDITYANGDTEPVNYYAGTDAARMVWSTGTDSAGSVTQADDVLRPDLAYSTQSNVWFYRTSIQPGTEDTSSIQAPDVNFLATNSNYAVGIFVKNVNAEQASLQLNWPGYFVGAVNWSYGRREISYTGSANNLNGGVLLCPDGWVELFMSVRTGPKSGPYRGPEIRLSPNAGASAYVYNLTFEKGLWPTNYCNLRPEESYVLTPVSLPNITTSQTTRPLAGG